MKSAHIKIVDGVFLDTFSNEFIFIKHEGSERVRIEQMTAHLIALLAANSNTLVSREELIEEVWEGNRGVGNKALTKNIYKIRKVFEAQGLKNPIETLPKKGYRLKTLNGVKVKKPIKRPWLIAAAVIVTLIVLNIAIPGILHEVANRLGH